MKQDDFFKDPDPPVQSLPKLQVLQDNQPGYANRTKINEKSADITLAFAIDFSTHGEKLTARCAGDFIHKTPWPTTPEAFHREVLQSLAKLNLGKELKLNIAGNGIYTFKSVATQKQLNKWVYDCLQKLSQSHKITVIRSGGQTGIDTAGLVAALALEIPAIGYYPQGYKLRNKQGQDVNLSQDFLTQWLIKQSIELTKEQS